MLVLGIETSGREGSVALFDDGDVLEEVSLFQTGRRHARTLVAEARDLMRRHARTPRECDGVAISVGPGSFTGLRVGVVCAKTLAYATGCRVAAVETLAVIAANSPADVDRVACVLNAYRGEVFVGCYERSGPDRWKREGAIEIHAAETFDRMPVDVPRSGPALAEEVLQPREGDLPPEAWLPRAAHVARLGAAQLTDGNVTDAWTLQPLYVRRSAAEEQAERRLAGGGC